MKVEGRRKGEGVSISCSHSFNRMAVSIGKAAIKDAQYTAKVGGNCPHECMRQGFIKTCLKMKMIFPDRPGLGNCSSDSFGFCRLLQACSDCVNICQGADATQLIKFFT